MKRAVVFGLAAALGLAFAGLGEAYASDRAFSDDNNIERSGNWSRSDATGTSNPPSKKAGSGDADNEDAAVPIPRPKPGSKAAKAEAKRAKKAKDTAAKKAKTVKKDSSVPIPRKKEKPKASVQAGLAPSNGGDTSAPYRGRLTSDEIKEVLSGKQLSSRIDGKDARITLSEDGALSWTSKAGSGEGRWWTEKGRVCDRYDPAGDFPGRGTGCRSFEQKPDGYYSGGRKLRFLN